MSLPLVSAYMAGLSVTFGTFVYCYHKRKRNAFTDTEPWFPYHETRDQYYALQEAEPAASIPQLRAALLKRAMEDVSRIFDLREQKPALQQLAKAGTVGDDLWNEFTTAEAGMELELQEVVAEANELAPGWGETIFQAASDMLMHQRLKEMHTDGQRLRADAVKDRERRLVVERETAERLRVQREKESARAAEELIKEAEQETDGSGIKRRPNASG